MLNIFLHIFLQRTWSKKYPIRIRTNVRKPIANEDSNRPSEDVLGKPGSDHDLDRGGGSPTVMIPDPVVTAKKVLEDVALGVVSSSAESGTINPDMELRWKKGRESPPLIPLESVMKVFFSTQLCLIVSRIFSLNSFFQDDSEGEGAEDFDDALDNTQNDSEKSKVMASNVSTLINSGSGDQTTEEVVAKTATTDDSCGENKKDSLAVPAETAEGATESEESFEILAEDAESRTFFLFTRTSRYEREKIFCRFP